MAKASVVRHQFRRAICRERKASALLYVYWQRVKRFEFFCLLLTPRVWKHIGSWSQIKWRYQKDHNKPRYRWSGTSYRRTPLSNGRKRQASRSMCTPR